MALNFRQRPSRRFFHFPREKCVFWKSLGQKPAYCKNKPEINENK